MNIRLNKKDLDEAIRLEKKYWKTGDTDLFPAIKKAEEMALDTYDSLSRTELADIISAITRHILSTPYEAYYKILEILGYKIVDEQNEEKKK